MQQTASKNQRAVYHVSHDEDLDTWHVLREGEAEPAESHDDRADAIAAARSRAKSDKGQLVIHKPDGSILRECTYGYRGCCGGGGG